MSRRWVYGLIVALLLAGCGRTLETVPTLTPQFGTARPDKASDVSVSPAGALYTAGDFRDRSFLRRYSPSGKLIWQRTLNRASNLFYDSHFLAADPSGNAFVAISGPEADEANLAKYSPDGVRVWSKRLSDTIYGVATDGGGNLFVASGGRGYLTKYSPAGRKLWERWGFPAPLAVAVSAEGNVHIVREDGVVLKYANDGRKLWTKPVDFAAGFANYDPEHLELVVGKDGEVYVLARLLTELFLGGDSITYDAVLRLHAFDRNGAPRWTRTVAYLGHPSFAPGGVLAGVINLGLTVTGKGAPVLAYAGPSSRAEHDTDAFVTKYTRGGARVWRRAFGTSEHDGALGVAAQGTSALYVSGYSYADLAGPNKGFTDAFVRKLNAQGRTLWTR
jgi:hypothetical protein